MHIVVSARGIKGPSTETGSQTATVVIKQMFYFFLGLVTEKGLAIIETYT